MKKLICGFLFLGLICLSGCEGKDRTPSITTEVVGNSYISYVFDKEMNSIISKSVYDGNTGITTEYIYYYTKTGLGKEIVGINVITISKEGNIIGEFKNHVTKDVEE